MASIAKRLEKTQKEIQFLQAKRALYEQSVKQKLRTDGVYFSEKFYTLNGKPLTFEHFPYARQIFHDKARIIVLLWARSMAKTTTVSSLICHNLITHAHSGAMVAAPRDKQAWRITKEHIRSRFMKSQGKVLAPMINIKGGKNTESEIDIINGSKYLASGAWITGDSLRGPHVNWGFADELQDWSREAFDVFKEVVNLPPAQIIGAGTPKLKGSFFEELWLSSDMKEWNGKEWVPTNPDWDGYISGYHITQEYSPFVTRAELEQKRKRMIPRMFANEVLAQFYASGGVKPITSANIMQLLIKEPQELTPYHIIEKSLGVDWGNETRWVLLGKASSGMIVVLSTGIFDDIDTNVHVDRLRALLAREVPGWVICDSGYGKTKNQMLMKEYPGVVWSCFATNTRTIAPSWDVIDEIDGNPLSQEDSQYHVSVNHTVLCENVENIVAKKMVRFLYLPDTRINMDSLFYELTLADADEVKTQHGRERRFNITQAHGYAAWAYALLPFLDLMDSVVRAPRHAFGPRI